MQHVSTLHIQHRPGTTFHYKSIDTKLLGIILARATGTSLSQYLEEKLWHPLGMEFDASWSLDREEGVEQCPTASPWNGSLSSHRDTEERPRRATAGGPDYLRRISWTSLADCGDLCYAVRSSTSLEWRIRDATFVWRYGRRSGVSFCW